MGMPLPSRNQSSIAARQKSPVPLPRRNSSSAGVATAQAAGSLQDMREGATASGKTSSIVTLIMVSIAAFCIGMLVLAYLARK